MFSLNRTFMELKLEGQANEKGQRMRLNRTFMELKRSSASNTGHSIGV